MHRLLFLVLLVTSGCSTIDHSKLFQNAKEPMQATDITICKGNFIETGMDCAELQGYPRLIHPLFLMFFGCTVNYYNQKGETQKSIIFTSSNFALKHELEHTKGYKDSSFGSQETNDKIEIQRIDNTVKKFLNKYAENCSSLY